MKLSQYLVLFAMCLMVSGCVDGTGIGGAFDQGEEVCCAKPPEDAPVEEPTGFAQVEWKLVDKNKAMAENPKLVIGENKINAMDPISGAAQAYFSVGSRAHLLTLKHSVDLHKAQYDKNPTFDEFNTLIKQANVDLKGLYPWQVYAYDDQTGEIVILEDHEEKVRRHEEAGIPVPE